MIRTSKRLAAVPPSATVATTFKAQALQRAGKDVIGLAAGEPDFDTPGHIADAAKRAIDRGLTRYAAPAGLPELRDAIAGKLKRDNNLDYRSDQISVGCGAKQSLFNVMLATLDPGDEVIVPAPYWVSYVDIARIAGGTPVIVPCGRGSRYKLTPEALDAAITPSTKWLVLCSPSNPTGAIYSAVEQRRLAEVLARHPHVGIIYDHIYEHLVYGAEASQPINAVAPELHERTLIVNGLSKGYCMTGWRVGFVAGPTHVVSAVSNLQSQSTTSTSTISQWAAVEALNGSRGFMHNNNEIFKQRRDLVVDQINKSPGLSCDVPDGAFYVFASCAATIGKKTSTGQTIRSDGDFVDYLLDRGVAVVPGAAFGMSPFFRISYAASTEVLTQALARIHEACRDLLD
ncbi:pyridoxal phosphate-dependent aminotransferase [Microvirga rosea]|uniref:pyridoxal phosphate-dependent aminotransferase n=1 Tax=Microvirga rosea TaxID=2715425 RepID=UPI001D09B491|nr:pyridoxal phosphate-dependent aminotransferase [Microvirga rosea]MCB8821988.1 pyridoxal phosphate-dependent aminotransferase [Microvirga rosea]